MKKMLLKSKKSAKSSIESFKMKAQVEQDSLDTLISGLMGNCHDGPIVLMSSSGIHVTVVCICEIE